MSSATSAVEAWSKIGPDCLAQSARSSLLYATSWSYSATFFGYTDGCFCSRSAEHLIGWLRATPRGSKPTRSNFSEISLLKYRLANSAKSTPDPPGPPGLSTIAPIRLAGSVALRRATARPNFSPFGLA